MSWKNVIQDTFVLTAKNSPENDLQQALDDLADKCMEAKSVVKQVLQFGKINDASDILTALDHHPLLGDILHQFIRNGYNMSRPDLERIVEKLRGRSEEYCWKKSSADSKYQYWGGKVEFENLDKIKELDCKMKNKEYARRITKLMGDD